MGHIIRKILGDVDSDPEYRELTVEENANGMMHIHQGQIRIDIEKSQFERLRAGMLESYRILKEKHGWDD